MQNLKISLTLFSLLITGLSAPAQLTNGIYAAFDTTLGSFTSRIHYVKAPMAAANFIGLAEGSLSSIDLPSGRAQKGPFYDGLIFHRVISGFMIQGGSPNGLGTDGPGYSFVDTFNTNLLHSKIGTLSMANSGPHSNGSQFFVTLAPTPWLDLKHIVFGELIDGTNVLQAIGAVATGGNDKPLTDVVINSVEILRVGTAAEAFDVSTNNLPIVSATESSISGNSSTNLMLTFAGDTNLQVFVSSSPNSIDWTSDASGFTSNTNDLSLVISATSDREYFTTAQVAYPHTALVDPTPSSWELEFSGSSFSDYSFTLQVNSNGTSETYTSDFADYASGTLAGINYSTSRPYRLRFEPFLNPVTGTDILLLDLDLYFSSATNGLLQGTYYPNYQSASGSEAVTGTFQLSIP